MISTSLAVIVIGLNEQANLKRCFESVRKCLQECSSYRIEAKLYYVDSGSEDQSIKIASDYADRIFRLTGRPSAAAARSVGIDNSSEELLLFLDGDMELQAGWLPRAVQTLLSGNNEGVAGVSGIRDDIFLDEQGNVLNSKENVYGVKELRCAPHFGGAVLLRRSILKQTGGYRPELRMSEEPDLHARILASGQYVLELPIPFIRHHTPPSQPFLQRLIRLFKVNGPGFYFGQSFLNAITTGYLLGFLRVFRYTTIVWLSDILSLIFLLQAEAGIAIIVQGAIISYLLLVKRAQEYLIARARLLGIFFARIYSDVSLCSMEHEEIFFIEADCNDCK